MAKFELVREPAETWAVWDTEENQPAEDNGKVLIGLSHEDAALAASRLNLAFFDCSFRDRGEPVRYPCDILPNKKAVGRLAKSFGRDYVSIVDALPPP